MTSWPQNAYVGQKVVRLNKEFHPLDPTKPNETYTIKLIGLFLNQYIYFTLNEASCPFGNMGWLYVLFRPVQSTDTGMSILKELLIDPKANIPFDDFDKVKAWTRSNDFLRNI